MNLKKDPRYVEFIERDNRKKAIEQRKKEAAANLEAEVEAIRKERENKRHTLRMNLKRTITEECEQLELQAKEWTLKRSQIEVEIKQMMMTFCKFYCKGCVYYKRDGQIAGTYRWMKGYVPNIDTFYKCDTEQQLTQHLKEVVKDGKDSEAKALAKSILEKKGELQKCNEVLYEFSKKIEHKKEEINQICELLGHELVFRSINELTDVVECQICGYCYYNTY